MAFHDVRLPDTIARGAKGGPRFNTTVAPSPNGYEKRNINWSRTRGQWDIGYSIMTKADYQTVVAFFYARYGMAYGFRFKDFTDFEIENQPIGVGDDTTKTFQIFKRYLSGAYQFDRDILLPIVNTVQVYIDGVEKIGGWSVNGLTGILTFSTAPLLDEVISITCEFDIPVRFDTDSLNMSIEFFNAATVPSIPVVELRDV